MNIIANVSHCIIFGVLYKRKIWVVFRNIGELKKRKKKNSFKYDMLLLSNANIVL